MSIKIAVAEEKKHKVPPAIADGTKNVALIYKTPTSRQLLNELAKYQKNGKVSMSESEGVQAMMNLLDECIVGWEGIQDSNGKKLDFQKEYVEYLPFKLQMDFIQSVLTPNWMSIADGNVVKPDKKKDKELGNSQTM